MFYVTNVGNRRKIHYDNCIYGNKSLPEHRLRFKSLEDAIKSGGVLCKHCLSLHKGVKAEQDKINVLTQKFNLKYLMKNEVLYIKDGIEKWKLILSKNGKNILMFHKNSKLTNDAHSMNFFDGYHEHDEEFIKITDALEYIADHFQKYLVVSTIPSRIKDKAKSIYYKDTKRNKKKANKAKDSHLKYLKRCDKREAVGQVFKIMEMLKNKEPYHLIGDSHA